MASMSDMNNTARRPALRLTALLLSLLMISGCGSAAVDTTLNTDTQSTLLDTGSSADTGESGPVELPPPSDAYPSDAYYVISKREYLDKTTSGFLSQLVGCLSGHEFSKGSDGKCVVGMPDSKFEYLGGLYGADPRSDKHIKNVKSGLWEVWFDDDFSVDVVNQYILCDMYKQKKTTCQKLITDGWINYDVWDMGGGQRQAGAFGVISRRNYLPQFAGNTEYDNWYSYLSEPYIATDTLGMNAAGMPETARELAAMFSQVTGDRDNLLWAQMFSVMISRAYFESDIKSLILTSADSVFPEGSWPRVVLSDVFDVYEKHPDDWRAAYREFESRYYLEGDTTNTDTDINCGFAILDLLYGEGDYMKTCMIGSLAGYDCETTVGIALTVLGIMGGYDVLPEQTNEQIWQDGSGVLVNQVCPAHRDNQGVWMVANGLDDRIEIKTVIEKYQKNFEYVLAEEGGVIDEYYYYIPKQKLLGSDAVVIPNNSFESGDLSGFTVEGGASIISSAVTGKYAVQLKDNGEISTKISGLKQGETYAFTAYVRATDNASAYLFAKNGDNVQSASVRATKGTPKYEGQSSVKRTLVFCAVASEMEIGISFVGTGGEYAVADNLSVIRLVESEAGTVEIKNPDADSKYSGSITLTLTAKSAGEHYLKLTFQNENAKIVDLPLTVNYKKYASAALYKSDVRDGWQNADCLYIPILLGEGENTVSSIFDSSIYVYSAELVDVTERVE